MTIPAKFASEFIAAGHHYHIPPEVLAGVAQIETGMGANRGPSSAGAVGLMQFMPGTASGLGINPRDDRQAIWGAAKYLHQLGYDRDPKRALASYNAGPRNWQAGLGYARDVLSAATGFKRELAGGAPSSTTPPASSAEPDSGGGGGGTFSSQLAEVALSTALVAAGAVLTVVGARHTFAPGQPA